MKSAKGKVSGSGPTPDWVYPDERSDVWEDVRIDQIASGDQILSLDEGTGRFVPQTVEKLLDKGTQQVYELKTESGKSIQTTSEHPYLVKTQEVSEEKQLLGNVGFGRAFAFRELEGDIDQRGGDQSQGESYGNVCINSPNIGGHRSFLSNLYDIHQHSVPSTISNVNATMALDDATQEKLGMINTAPYQPAERLTNIPASDLSAAFLSLDLENNRIANTVMKENGLVNNREKTGAHSMWQKVKYLKQGMVIRTVDGWEKIATIDMVGRKPVYDVQIAGTHNFVGGHYVNGKTGQALTEEQEKLYLDYVRWKMEERMG